MGIKISSIGYYLPKQLVTNDDLVQMVVKRANGKVDVPGLKNKLALNKAVTRYFKQPNETGFDMAVIAAQSCFIKAGMNGKDLEAIIYAGMLRDYVEPCMAILLQNALGARNAHAFDISNACNGFLNALQIASLYLKMGLFKNALIIGAEDGSERIPWDMFANGDHFSGFSALTVSDGAAAMLIQAEGGPEKNFCDFEFQTFGEYHDLCEIPINRSSDAFKIKVKSKPLAKVAIEKLSKFIPEYIDRTERKLGNIDLIFLHQVSGDQKRFCGRIDKVMIDRLYNTFWKVGNTGSISIPLGMAMAEEEGVLKRGHRGALIVGASGFSIGATMFEF